MGNPKDLRRSPRARQFEELRQFTLALADARAALAINDKSADAHFEAAQDLNSLGLANDALEQTRIATGLDPRDSAKWLFRGVLERRRANFAAAIESQTRSLEINESLLALSERENASAASGR